MPEIPLPHPSHCDPTRADFDAIVSAHEAAARGGASTYRDPGTGLAVLTAAALLERGSCCDSGCRHCPYA